MHKALALLFGISAFACITERSPNLFESKFNEGDLDGAYSALKSIDPEKDVKNEFLDFVNNGVLLSRAGRFDESNECFEKAFLFGEDYYVRYSNGGASQPSASGRKIYRGEDHEHLMVLYYKVLNYLEMGKPEEALVECQRLIIRQQQFAYHPVRRSLRWDESIFQVVIGVTYELNGDYCNAFIAYKAAVEWHTRDNDGRFTAVVPLQLEMDLLRMADLSGQVNEFEKYKKEFNLPLYTPPTRHDAELIVFWNTGRCPIKGEWLTVFDAADESNYLSISNEKLGLNFCYVMDHYTDYLVKEDGITKIKMRLPRYLDWPSHFTKASLRTSDGQLRNFELLQDVKDPAAKILMDKTRRQLDRLNFSNILEWSLLKDYPKAPKDFNHEVDILDTAPSIADHRCWETLPRSIYYCRVGLKEGENAITIDLGNRCETRRQHYNYHANRQQAVVRVIHSLEWNVPDY